MSIATDQAPGIGGRCFTLLQWLHTTLLAGRTRIIDVYSFLLNSFRSVNSLFKVLFIFPSQYLFAIGLPSLFSLRRSLSPILSCNPKQLDSSNLAIRTMYLHRAITFLGGVFQLTSGTLAAMIFRLQFSCPEGQRLSVWAVTASLAATRVILFNVFSSA